ncbi:MAG: hypothetical protein AAF752_07475 [Bacteroidota bacterium]
MPASSPSAVPRSAGLALAWLQRTSAEVPPVVLQPNRFFVAWHGVLTVSFLGFPRPVLGFKRQIERRKLGLNPEYPGSRWPHTTLGALHEDATLQRSDLDTLLAIARRHEPALLQESVLIDAFRVVQLGTRSHEFRRLTLDLPLGTGPAISEVPVEHANLVASLLTPFSEDMLETYWPRVNSAEHRAPHYQTECGHASLVMDWPHRPLPAVDAFLQDVEAALPGKYVFFPPSSRHITVRALEPLNFAALQEAS